MVRRSRNGTGCSPGVPPPPSISGIIELAGNRKLNPGAQSLAAKILLSKNLHFMVAGYVLLIGRDALSAQTASTRITHFAKHPKDGPTLRVLTRMHVRFS